MEVVNVFNKELKSILECKLPVSRHKMSLITKSAMKALKFYKHVVQSVEKFIAKCSCDYKVPGLYVIDAIVRQSKHQYCDKDVFVPRFMRNIVTTFLYLSQCDSKDLPSIERVLRLWQQNGVFPTDLVEALLELLYESTESEKVLNASKIVMKLVNEWNVMKGKAEEKLEIFMPAAELYNHQSNCGDNNSAKSEGGLIDSITKLLTKFHAETGQDVSAEIKQIQVLHQKIVEQSALLAQGEMIDADTLSQLHQSMEELTKKAAKAAAVQQSKLAMLSTDDKDHLTESSTDMEFVEQLQQMVDTLSQTRALQEELRQTLESKRTPPETTNTDTTTTNDIVTSHDHDFREEFKIESTSTLVTGLPNDIDMDFREMNNSTTQLPRVYNQSENGSIHDYRSRSSSPVSRKRRRSHSESKGKRSASREHRKKEKKSRKKYMPIVRQSFVGIVSHTIFIGHLNKHVSEQKLRTLCEDYGTIQEFHMIPPRGCAFVTFQKRKYAYRAINKMNEFKFEGRELKVAWAPNKGVKDDREFRECWVEHEGCTYISTEQFPINRSSELVEGGAELDEETLTDELRMAIRQFEQQKADAIARGLEASSVETMITVAAEVANKKIPLLNSAESYVDPDTQQQFYSHFPPPPPMMPPIIPYPPPPHLYMAPPVLAAEPPMQSNHITSAASTASSSNIDITSSAGLSSSDQSSNAIRESTISPPVESSTSTGGPLIVGSIRPQPPAYSSNNNRLPPPDSSHSHMIPPNHPLPFMRPGGFRGRMMLPTPAAGRMFRHPMRYRPPPPGYPAFIPNLMNRHPATRY